MFKNPGQKLKLLAKIVFYVLLFLPLVIGIVLIVSGLLDGVGGYGVTFPAVLFGILLLGIGLLNAWLSSILLYAFGELIEYTRAIKKDVEKIRKLEEDLQSK